MNKSAWDRAQYLAQTSGGEPEDHIDEARSRGRGSWNAYAHGERSDGEVVAEYVYRQPDREPYLRVERVKVAGEDRHQFPQSHWASGRWQFGKPKGPAIPYMLPDLLEAPPDQTLWICEGEKDAEAVINIGGVATTSPEGAGKWRPELNRWFEGKQRVVILPDNDDAGRRHADKVARNLSGCVGEVKIVALPGLEEHGDVSDWIAAGGTLEALTALCGAAPAYTGSLLDAMNEKYCVVSAQGKARVLTFDRAAEGERQTMLLQPFQDFRALHDHKRLGLDDKKSIGEGSWWLSQRERRQYDGLVFRPGLPSVINERLNLWQGWGIEPRQGDWKLLKQHMDEVLAAGDKTFAEYLLKWTAWTFQNPGKPAEVALVFRGGRGTGKGVFGRAMKDAFGQHGLHISSSNQMTGQFNAHLMDCALLFADEAYWPGDKAAEGTLQRLITEPTLFVEKKGFDGFQMNSSLHVIMAANSDWVVPAGKDERRYAASEVSEHHQQSRQYFEPLYAEIAAGGVAAMMHDLLAYDLGGWHPRHEVPSTAALDDQKMRSLSPEDQWWLALLQAGELPSADEENPRLAPSAALFEHARKTVPGLKWASDHALARIIKRHGCDRDSDWRVGGRRAWRFPPLKDARQAWVGRMATKWEDPAAEDWAAESM